MSDDRAFDDIVDGIDLTDTSDAATKEAFKTAQKRLISGLDGAVGSVLTLSKHAENEQLRFKAATFIIERCLVKPGDDPTEAWKAFMEDIHSGT